MFWPDEKSIAIIALMAIAIVVILVTKNAGLDTITNIVCAIGGFVTGGALSKIKTGGIEK